MRTPRGGLHLYFRYPAGMTVRSKAALVGLDGRRLSLDVRGDGGYVIAAGSIRKDGAAYEAADAAWPPLVPEAPQWLLDLVVGRKPKPAKQPQGDRSDFRPIGGTPYGLAALSNECLELRTAPRGTRNHRLNTAAFKLAQLCAARELDEGTVRVELLAAAIEAGLDEDPNCGLSGIRKTIESGVQAGMEKPRQVADRRGGKPKIGRQRASDPDEPAEDENSLVSEDAVAKEVAVRFGGYLTYCQTDGKWYRWAGTHWHRDEKLETFDTCRRVATELAADAEDKDRKAAGRATFVSGVEKFCQRDPVFSTTASEFDRDPFLLGTPSGTVDLRTGLCRPADPTDRITKLTGCGVAEMADCPHFRKFLWEITGGDRELVRFFQQWSGYCLTGATTEHAMLFIVQFDYKPAKPDRQLEAKLTAEGPGVLRWAIDGCLDWQRNGLIRPASMLEETRQYFVEQDAISRWLDCSCEVTRTSSDKEMFADLFASWKRFCEQTGEDVGTAKAFAKNLRKRDFQSKRGTNGAMQYVGIRFCRGFTMAAE